MIVGIGAETYLFTSGIRTKNIIKLSDSVTLLPASPCSSLDNLSSLVHSDLDFSIVVLNLPRISSQLHVKANDEKELAMIAWNAQWDCILLGAVFDCEVICNLQSDRPIEESRKFQYLNITNYSFRVITNNIYTLTIDDEKWILSNYEAARCLLDSDGFLTAVHSMATYRWHSLPRVQMAIIWSGIEALFDVSSEISFRLSFYIALYLSDDREEASKLFSKVRELYKYRSLSVHGNKLKADIFYCVKESAMILNRLIRRCAERKGLPNTDDLLFKKL